MQLSLTDIGCDGTQKLVVNQAQGDNTPIKIVFKDQDITDWDFKGTILFPSPIDLEVGEGITIVAAETGWIQLQLTSEQTQNVPTGQYRFDLWSTTSGIVPVNTDPLTGYFNIESAITVIS